MSSVSIEPTIDLDLADIALHSTEEDKEEALVVLEMYLRSSSCSWCGKINGRVACIWGLVIPTLLSNHAHIWLLTTELVEEHKFLFVRHSQLFMEGILKTFPIITGHVVMKQQHSVRWLRWLGVEFREPIRGLRKDTIFIPFVIRKS